MTNSILGVPPDALITIGGYTAALMLGTEGVKRFGKWALPKGGRVEKAFKASLPFLPSTLAVAGFMAVGVPLANFPQVALASALWGGAASQLYHSGERTWRMFRAPKEAAGDAQAGPGAAPRRASSAT